MQLPGIAAHGHHILQVLGRIPSTLYDCYAPHISHHISHHKLTRLMAATARGRCELAMRANVSVCELHRLRPADATKSAYASGCARRVHCSVNSRGENDS
ncbi:uncharacterized protein PHACADRAFT_255743 [Phanerochaete carnosa HHB-10118-sp]|uniref:Uncharacterized protein n=1 Tax=Phanerochaete carnosa (strain HHB-10118-sp) TaxID=650164 RepID=K5WXP0_PHACS|nr:uncharacterized protein PHACADRAFT_255743 [Phanerochaete carnosa HHB-10118-sp]EKM55257.1 hypothetical protein PHACADRAFT_255743 [Phanerochaete carnosa HHB-10118-sp]